MIRLLPLTVTDSASDALGEALPSIGGALLLIVVGLLVARVVGRLARRALRKVGVDELAERWGVHAVLARGGLPGSLSHAIGRTLRIIITVVVVFAALSLLGLSALSDTLNEVVLFLPRLLAAIALAIAGLIVGGLARERIDRLAGQMDLSGPLGGVAQATVLMVFGVLALAQLGVPTTVLVMVLAIGIGAAGLTVALAFGLGGRDVARQISAGRYLAGDFRIGQRIAFEGVEEDIVAMSGAAAVIKTDAGESVRIPHHLLLESIVRIHD